MFFSGCPPVQCDNVTHQNVTSRYFIFYLDIYLKMLQNYLLLLSVTFYIPTDRDQMGTKIIQLMYIGNIFLIK